MPDIKEPIKIYENDMQLQSSLKEWQARLFLDGWCITVELVDDIDIGVTGRNWFVKNEKYAYIQMLKSHCECRYGGVFISRNPQEKTLIHELLHCKIGYVQREKNFENDISETYEHQLIDELAKSLIMAKYDLPFDWFKEPYIK